MDHLLHVSAAAVKETDDGNIETITLGAVSINAADLIPLVGEEVVLKTPGAKGRSFHGCLRALLVKDSKHGPEVTLKVEGGTDLNGLVGTNVTIEAAQIPLPVGAVAPRSAVEIAHDIATISSGKQSVTLTAKQEVEKVVSRALNDVMKAKERDDQTVLDGDGKADNPYSGVVPATFGEPSTKSVALEIGQQNKDISKKVDAPDDLENF